MREKPRGGLRKPLCLAALPVLLLAGLAYTERGGFAGGTASLSAVLSAPGGQLGRSVTLWGRFAGEGELFLELHTPFTADSHLNFAVWPEEVRHWEPAGRDRVLPTLYIPRHAREAAAVLAGLRHYDRVEIRGWVRADYANRPWIQVERLARDTRPEAWWPANLNAALAEADRALAEGDFDRAAATYSRALDDGVPFPHRATVARRAAAAEQAAGRPYAAWSRHREVVVERPADPVAWGRLAEAALAADHPEDALAAVDRALALLAGAAREGRPATPAPVASNEIPGDPRTALGGSCSAPEGTALLVRADYWGLRAEVLGRLGRVDEGLSWCERAGREDGLTPLARAQAYLRRARLRAAQRRFDDAAVAYEQVLEAPVALARAPWLLAEWASFLAARAAERPVRTERLRDRLAAVDFARRAHAGRPGGWPALLARAAGWALAEEPAWSRPAVWPHTESAADAVVAVVAGAVGEAGGTDRNGAAARAAVSTDADAASREVEKLSRRLSVEVERLLADAALERAGAGAVLRLRWEARGWPRAEALAAHRALLAGVVDEPGECAALAEGLARLGDDAIAGELFARAAARAPWDITLRGRAAEMAVRTPLFANPAPVAGGVSLAAAPTAPHQAAAWGN